MPVDGGWHAYQEGLLARSDHSCGPQRSVGVIILKMHENLELGVNLYIEKQKDTRLQDEQ